MPDQVTVGHRARALCSQVKPELAAYHDGDVDELTRIIVEAHLAECPACREELSRVRALDNTFRAWAAAAAPERSPSAVQSLSRQLSAEAASVARAPYKQAGARGSLWGSVRAVTFRAIGTTVRVARRTTVSGVRAGAGFVRGTLRAGRSLTSGWQRTTQVAATTVSAGRRLWALTTAGARRVSGGAVVLG